jgi:formate dehydrogenase iron-sulfur subunit
MSKAILIDTTKCIGCRSCQVSCKEWNELPGEITSLPRSDLGLQNPVAVSSKTLTLITYHEIADEGAPGNLKYVFAKRQCMHCDDPACASACPVTALHKTAEGPVIYDSDKCIGCRYCIWACPFGAPTAQWDSVTPKIRKCTMCYDRISQPAPSTLNGRTLTIEEQKRFMESEAIPACVKQCPAGALQFGERDSLLAEAKSRIKNHPEKYVDHIYGEHEAGGTSTFYLASVPFAQIGFPQVRLQSYAEAGALARDAVPPSILVLGALLGGTYALYQRREATAQAAKERPRIAGSASEGRSDAMAAERKAARPHVEFAASGLVSSLRSRLDLFLLSVAAVGGLSFLVRFFLGLGGSTNLSDTYPWGLWIAFLLIRIAISAGSFVMGGLIYVARRKDLYPMGRTAVLLGALSYASVLVTLIADIGRPWNFWQVLVQAPKHSAMYEVSWCITLYFIILLVELMPLPFERWGLVRAARLWRKYSPPFVVASLTAFVFLMSRNLVYTLLAFVVFGILAYVVRAREGEETAPALLAIAGIVFATMHQSSLGSLFLLMPDKLSALWWSPLMPLYFLLSSLAAGTALVVLVEMWIAKGYSRPLRIPQLAALGKVTFVSLLVYELARIADVVLRGQVPRVLTGTDGKLFLIEMGLLGALPLVLLCTNSLRKRPGILGFATMLVLLGVVLNRLNVVFFAMHLKGPMPQIAASGYFPSVWEWGLSVGLIAAAILLFRLGVQILPVLPKEENTTLARPTA